MNHSTLSNKLTTPEGLLTAEYTPFKRLIALKDKAGTPIPLSALWINKFPAIHLRLFDATKISFDKAIDEKRSGDRFKVSFNNWSWWNSSIKNKIPISIIVKSEEEDKEWEIEIPPFLTILGLKVWIIKKLANKSWIENTNRISLMHHEEELDNEYTINDYALKKYDIINFHIRKLGNQVLYEQNDKGVDSFSSILDFTSFNLAMNPKIDLVCHICVHCNNGKEGYGTGFLISKDHIMTNDHVLSDRGGKIRLDLTMYPQVNLDTATFFYDDDDEKKAIVVPLDKVIYTSKSPRNGPITEQKLDFCIVKMNTSTLKPMDRIKLYQLSSKAEQICLKTEKINNHFRANIIQHPTISQKDSDGKEISKKPMPKKIAFRENLITLVREFELHYQTQTDKGSSGSPVFDDDGNFIGLHRSGCTLIELMLSKKWRELEKEIQMHFAYNFPEYSLELKFISETNIEWRIDSYKASNSQDGHTLLSLLEHISRNFKNLIVKNKEKLWACSFLKRLSGEITDENMEKTLRLKLPELRNELQKLIHINNLDLDLTLIEKEKFQINWTITNDLTYNGTTINGLLSHLKQNYPILINKDTIRTWASAFLRKQESEIVEDLEKHINCSIAVIASKIFLDIQKNQALERVFERKRWNSDIKPLSERQKKTKNINPRDRYELSIPINGGEEEEYPLREKNFPIEEEGCCSCTVC